MKDTQRRLLENQLIVMGLRKLTDPELIPQMAELIKDHEFYLGMLNEVSGQQRQEMYEALRPHLKFRPWPLETYVAKMKERAAAIESREQPIAVGDKQYQEVPHTHADGVVVDVKCALCPRTNSYFGKTPLTAVILARQDGWVRDKLLNKEVCPKCPSEFRGKRKTCPNCKSRHFPPTCNVAALADKEAEMVYPTMDKTN
jgi:hypothetical protein